MLINVVDRKGRNEGGWEDQDEEEDLSKSSDNNTGANKTNASFFIIDVCWEKCSVIKVLSPFAHSKLDDEESEEIHRQGPAEFSTVPVFSSFPWTGTGRTSSADAMAKVNGQLHSYFFVAVLHPGRPGPALITGCPFDRQ